MGVKCKWCGSTNTKIWDTYYIQKPTKRSDYYSICNNCGKIANPDRKRSFGGL